MSSSTSTKSFPSTSLSAALAIWEPASARQRPMLFAASVMDSTWYRSILSAVSSARSTISSSEWASVRMSAPSRGEGSHQQRLHGLATSQSGTAWVRRRRWPNLLDDHDCPRSTDSGASLLYGRPRPTQDLNGAFGRRDGFLIRFLSEEPAADPNQGQAEFDQHG